MEDTPGRPVPVRLQRQSERRGTPLSAWGDRRTLLRAEVFRRVAGGDAHEVVGAALGISPAQVRAVLSTERRGVPAPAPDVLEVHHRE